MAGAEDCYEHVAEDDRSVKGLEVSVGSMAGSLVGASPVLGNVSPRCTVDLTCFAQVL